MRRFLSIIVSALVALPQMFSYLHNGGPAPHVRDDGKCPNVFVGGLLAYGEQASAWYLVPTFGIYADVLRMLEAEGYECYVTSPGTFNSNWDRACNVYAELTGSVVDYGEAHSKAHRHARYGWDFGGRPLLEDWGPDRPINLFGHSLGGQTIYLLAGLMAEGSAEEQAATPEGELSPLFEGGHSNLIHSVTALGGILNGTIAEPTFIGDWFYWVQLPFFCIGSNQVFQYTGLGDAANYIRTNDHSLYDLTPAGAAEMNHKIRTQEDIYYFAYTLCDTTPDAKGTLRMDKSKIPDFPPGPVLYLLGEWMGRGDVRHYGETIDYPGGPVTIDETWWPNDGAANVAASKYPFGSPHKEFDAGKIERGTWQAMPTMQGYNHGFFGGFDFGHSVAELRDFYLAHLRILDKTY